MADYKKVQIVDSNGNLLDEINVKDEVARNGMVNKSGDTMTGDLKIEDSYPTLEFKQSNTSLGAVSLTANQIIIREYPADQQQYSEVYRLPIPNSGMTSTRFYEILTSKDPVTVAQGGTGGNDSGWKQLKNASVFTGTISYRKIGIFLTVITTNTQLVTTLASNTSVVLGQLPDGYRPDLALACACMTYTNISGIRVFPLRIAADGTIYLYANSDAAIPNTATLNFSGFGFTNI